MLGEVADFFGDHICLLISQLRLGWAESDGAPRVWARRFLGAAQGSVLAFDWESGPREDLSSPDVRAGDLSAGVVRHHESDH